MDFNHSIQNCIPSSVTYLKFGHDFDQSIKGLPSSVTHLSFGYCFDNPIDDLPSSIIHLSFVMYEGLLEHLPKSVTDIVYHYIKDFDSEIIEYISDICWEKEIDLLLVLDNI